MGLEEGTDVSSQNDLLDIAIQLRESGKFDEAIGLLEEGITKFSEDPNILVLL